MPMWHSEIANYITGILQNTTSEVMWACNDTTIIIEHEGERCKSSVFEGNA